MTAATGSQTNNSALRQERNRYAALAFVWGDLLLEIDTRLRVVFATGAAESLLGIKPEDLAGRSLIEMMAPQNRALGGEMLEAARQRGRMDSVIVRMVGRKGLTPPLSMAGYFLPDLDGHFFIALRVSVDTLPDHLVRQVKRDEESGLFDSTSFAKVATERTLAGKEAGREYQMSMMTLTAFDDMCQRLEETSRQEMMQGIGAFLRAQSVAGDSAAKLADNQFGLVHRPEIRMEELEDRIIAATKATDPQGVGVTIESVSAPLGNEQDYSQADVARGLSYAIRKFCHGQGERFTLRQLTGSMPVLIEDTVGAIRDFARRIENRDFQLAFQPIVTLPGREISHFEALARFANANGEMVNPAQIIEFAEEVGITPEFDYAVLRRTLRWLKSDTGKTVPTRVAVNISGHSIEREDFCERVMALLDQYPECHQRLMLEVTETARIEGLTDAARWLHEFRRKGIHICLDDFGTGASNLRYLSAFEVDFVKVDGESIAQALENPKGKVFLSSLVELCRSLDVRTVAEMIESEETLKAVSDAGFDCAQGFLFGKPEVDIERYGKMKMRQSAEEARREAAEIGGSSWM